jgi:hypothetical protein
MSEAFGFTLSELDYWVIKRKDGETVKYMLNAGQVQPVVATTVGHHNAYNSSDAYHLSPTPHNYVQPCRHDAEKPVYSNDTVALYIADAHGCRRGKDWFGYVLDCGNILTVTMKTYNPDERSGLLVGDIDMVDVLDQYVEAASVPSRILQIDWDDRQEPDLQPEFWPALAKLLSGDVLCACQGGHGRSGTALTALLMCYNPEYSAKDAIIHLRAMHCARAIESVKQHEYLDKVAESLGREANAIDTQEVKSFKDAFLALKHESARPFQESLTAKTARVS